MGFTISATSDKVVHDVHTVTSQESSAKKFLLSKKPVVTSVQASVRGGPMQFRDEDYSIDGQYFDWSGLGLDGVLETGDVVDIQYIRK